MRLFSPTLVASAIVRTIVSSVVGLHHLLEQHGLAELWVARPQVRPAPYIARPTRTTASMMWISREAIPREPAGAQLGLLPRGGAARGARAARRCRSGRRELGEELVEQTGIERELTRKDFPADLRRDRRGDGDRRILVLQVEGKRVLLRHVERLELLVTHRPVVADAVRRPDAKILGREPMAIQVKIVIEALVRRRPNVEPGVRPVEASRTSTYRHRLRVFRRGFSVESG